MDTAPSPLPDGQPNGGRIALLALAGALFIIFLTLFVVGLALGNRDASVDEAATFTPAYASATALRTLAPQTPGLESTQTSRETPAGGSGGGGKPTRTPTPTVTPSPTATDTPIPPTPTEIPIPPTIPSPTPTICSFCG
jgi:hypothetical protein